MKNTRKSRIVSTLLVALLLFTVIPTLADESAPMESSSPTVSAAEQRPKIAAPAAGIPAPVPETAPQEETQAPQEPEQPPARQEEPQTQEPPPAKPPTKEPPVEAPLSRNEVQVTAEPTEDGSGDAPTEKDAAEATSAPEDDSFEDESTEDNIAQPTPGPMDEESLLEPTPDPDEELLAENTDPLLLTCTIRWIIDTPGNLLHWGDKIALEAEFSSHVEGLQLQWQAATKSTDKLQEDEPEWEDIPGAHGDKYIFTVTGDMQDWRWRLRMSTPEGEEFSSDEIMLPEITESSEVTEANNQALDAEDAAVLPVGNITATADVPPEEISYGTKIALVAEIENPQEGMLLQWQHRPADAEHEEKAWQDIGDATELVYSFVLDEENAGWLWRLLITVPEASYEDNIELTVNEQEETESLDIGESIEEDAPSVIEAEQGDVVDTRL